MIEAKYIGGPFDGAYVNLDQSVPPLTITLAQIVPAARPTPDEPSTLPTLKHFVYASNGAVDKWGVSEYHYTGTTDN